MNQEVVVSIIIPTFNSGAYINRCLTALNMQTYKQLEIIIVDAGSTDNTLTIIKKHQPELTIKYFIIGQSTQSEARNYGIKQASGKYLSFCDSDDFYLPEKINKQVALMEKEPIDVSYFDVLHFYSDQEKRLFLNLHPTDEDIFAECIMNQTINLNSIMVEKQFIDEKKLLFPTGLMGKYGEDGNFIFQLALHQAQFKKLDEHLSVVEIREDSHTQWETQWQMKYYAIQYRTEAKVKIPPKYYPLLEETIKKLKYKLIISLIIAGKYQDARQELKSIARPYFSWLITSIFFFLQLIPQKTANKVITYLWGIRRSKMHIIYPIANKNLQEQLQYIFNITN